MDARLETGSALGLNEGDAHIIRNAGGVVTDDVIRSLIISQRLLQTREIMVLHHSGCGMLTFTDQSLKDSLEEETGIRPDSSLFLKRIFETLVSKGKHSTSGMMQNHDLSSL